MYVRRREITPFIMYITKPDRQRFFDELINISVYLSIKSCPVVLQALIRIEPLREKTNNLGSDQVRHKANCTVTEDG